MGVQPMILFKAHLGLNVIYIPHAAHVNSASTNTDVLICPKAVLESDKRCINYLDWFSETKIMGRTWEHVVKISLPESRVDRWIYQHMYVHAAQSHFLPIDDF